MTGFEGFLFGCGGGVAAEVLKWWNVRDELRQKNLPDWSKSYIYWVVTGFMILLGGALVVVYIQSGAVLNALLAVQVGVSTPLIISGISKEAPKIPPGSID
ncbi:MAG: hypothetical protein O3A84_06290 [Proteobacteria bacterium]|nr:hypothetical protein [Pseudomonadota bacterium]